MTLLLTFIFIVINLIIFNLSKLSYFVLNVDHVLSVISGEFIPNTNNRYCFRVLEDGAHVFRGIPYALPPTGNLRFAPPKTFTLNDCWNGTLKVHNHTPPCWQMFVNGSLDGDEDCLTLDVYSPQVRYDSPAPVS